MTIEEFRAALRKTCDDQVELLKGFQARLQELEKAVKSTPGADMKLITAVCDLELKRYEQALDKL